MPKLIRKVVVTQKFFDEQAIQFLIDRDIEVEIANLPGGKSEAQLTQVDMIDLLEGANGWIVGHANITGEVLSALPDLQIISRRGVGYEKVDTCAAEKLGKVVTIAAGGNDASVADQAIGMMLSIGRRFREAQAKMNHGHWNILVGNELYLKTVGIIGFGRTGRSLARRLVGFDCEILVHTSNLTPQDMNEYGVRTASLEEIYRQSDYISIHAPLRRETSHMIDASVFQMMKSTAVLINTARGGIVDDRALLEALQQGEILGAGLDVYESEADPKKKSITDALIARHDVIAAPHAGASTHEALARTNLIAAKCAASVINGTNPPRECIIVDGRS